MIFIPGAFAVTGSPSNFESADGNMTLQTPGNTDWNCFDGANGFQSSPAAPAGCKVKTGATAVTADQPASVGEITWTKGQKFDTMCPTIATKSTPPKDDFTNVAEYAEFDTSGDATNGDLFFYGASIRSTANGNTSGDIEFDQNGTFKTTGLFGCRTGNDRLVAYDFLGGGTTLDFHILTWITSTTGPGSMFGGNTGNCFVKTDAPPCWGANILTPTTSSFDGSSNNGISPATGAINSTDNGISGTDLAVNQFAEFGVDLTKALLGASGGSLPCFPQQVWESRSSGSSFTSSPEDLEFAGLNTCGSITIIKHTEDGTGARSGVNKDFSYTSTGGLPTPSSFTLNDATGSDVLCPVTSGTCNTQFYNGTVHSGSYTVSETVPAGYTLVSLNCTNSGGNTGVQHSAGSPQTDITVTANGSTTCTYTNEKNTAALATTQSTTASVYPGNPVNDTATVTGNQSTINPSGTVTFYLCGPSKTALTGCSSSDTSRTNIGTGTLGNGTGGVSTATSPNVNCTANGTGCTTGENPLAVGNYCFEATWPGDTNYPGALDDSTTNSTTNSECFTVAKDNTQTVTTPNDGTHLSTYVSSIILGGTEYDTAVVSGTAAGGDPGGSVDFYVCGPTLTTSTQLCDGTTGNVGTHLGSVILVGNGNDTSTATVASPGFTPTMTGRYCFRAVYGGSLKYNTSSDSSATECFTVTQISTNTVTTPSVGQNGSTTFGSSVTDSAVISAAAAGGGPITGTVAYFICNPMQVSLGGCPDPNGTAEGSTTMLTDQGMSPPVADAASSSAVTVNMTGTWCWRAVFTPGGTDGNQYTGSSDFSSTECFMVTDTTTSTSAQNWLPNDMGTVTSTHGAPLNGTLSIQLYSNADCGATESGAGAVSGQLYSKLLSNAASPQSLTTSNTTYKVSTSTSVSWLVDFDSSGDANVTASSHCESTSLTINN